MGGRAWYGKRYWVKLGLIVWYKYSLGPGLDSISPDIISNISFTLAMYSISIEKHTNFKISW